MPKSLQRIATCLPVYLSACLTLPAPLHAWTGDYIDPTDGQPVATLASFTDLFSNILSIVLRLVGLSMFIMIIVGGFKILIAGSDAKAAEAGQQTITSAIIGLVLAVGAWFILLAIKGFTGVNVTQFKVGL